MDKELASTNVTQYYASFVLDSLFTDYDNWFVFDKTETICDRLVVFYAFLYEDGVNKILALENPDITKQIRCIVCEYRTDIGSKSDLTYRFAFYDHIPEFIENPWEVNHDVSELLG